jgi:IS5 family transposase
MRFLGLDVAGRVPDYSTVWRFREALAKSEAIEPLFARFDSELKEQGYFVRARRPDRRRLDRRGAAAAHEQRREGTDQAWRGSVLAGREGAPQGRRRPLDHQAWPREEEAWAGAEIVRAAGLLIPAFGYKNHINVDRRHRLIRRWTVTNAAAHDGTRLPEILDKSAFHSRVRADSAYRSTANERAIEKAGRVR